jgi:Protein of unknown function (DUF3485)
MNSDLKNTQSKITSLRFKVAVGLVVILSGVSALAHGLLESRWGSQTDLVERGLLLAKLPDTMGDWTLVESPELPESAAEQLRCYGYNHSVYQSRQTGKSVVFAVLFGPRGPIAVHTPEVCYSGAGVQAAADRNLVAIGDKNPHTFWRVSFLSKVDAKPEIDVYYAWSDGGPWQAAEQPRFWMIDSLYKIQIAGPPRIPGQPSECEQFLEQVVPHLAPLIKRPD